MIQNNAVEGEIDTRLLLLNKGVSFIKLFSRVSRDLLKGKALMNVLYHILCTLFSTLKGVANLVRISLFC